MRQLTKYADSPIEQLMAVALNERMEQTDLSFHRHRCDQVYWFRDLAQPIKVR